MLRSLNPSKDKSGVGVIVAMIKDYIVLNGDSYYFPTFTLPSL